MTTANQVLDQMRRLIGVTESPPGSNCTAVGVAFGWSCVPWCAQTISVACKRAGITNWWSASTDQMEAWARSGRVGSRWLAAGSSARPGDICVWDWKKDGTANHVSMVESVYSDGRLVTIGGNESNRVQRAVRSRSGLRGFIRLAYSAAAAPPPPPPPATSTPHPTLKSGSTGIAVKEYQWKMNAVTGTKLLGDGKYDAPDVQACKNLQTVMKLTVTGVCDTKTWAVLDYLYAAKFGH